jgi:hypothetical protein
VTCAQLQARKNLTPLAKKSHLHFEIKKLEISVVKHEAKSRNKWEDNNNMHIRGQNYNNVDWNHLAQEIVQF